MRIEANTNFKELGKWLTDIERKQLPFAVAVSLTRVAQGAAGNIKQEMRDEFTLRSSFSERGIKIQNAKKSQWPNPYSIVGIDDKRSYLADHVQNTIRKPKGRARAVPTDNAKRTRTGKLRRSDQVREALRDRGANGKKGRKRQAFRSGRLVMRRKGRGGKELEVLHVFTPQVRIKRKLPIDTIAASTMRKTFGRHFSLELEKAVRSRRVRAGSFSSAGGRRAYLGASRKVGGR